METPVGKETRSFGMKLRHRIFGAPKDIQDPKIFHKLSLIPLLAWVGLGADGLSSSAYGPEEAFRALGSHAYLALLLGVAIAATVFIISYAYSRIIEHFPHGGGGYIVATHMLGEKAGVVSGSALLVDYVLTITISIASCTDALFSYLPLEYHAYKIPVAAALIVWMIVMNIRGVKESITVLAPIFMLFFFSHVFLLAYGVLGNASRIAPVVADFRSSFARDIGTMGGLGMLLVFLHAYSLGGGTYTGIEAVSNGLQIMRQPRVQTGKRTMIYMASSLAFTAGGLCLCYLLMNVHPMEGKTLNAVLAEALYGHWRFGHGLAVITILSEGALLLVAAQAGFIDGPRVMANMAVDSWLPHRFSALSERLTMRNGVMLMGTAALLFLYYTHGLVSTLVVMYSINVFLTFSLSEFGMSRFFIKNRKKEKKWKQHLSVHLTGLTLCVTILVITTHEKFREGGWITLLITAMVIGLCYLVKGHYSKVREELGSLDRMLLNLPTRQARNEDTVDPKHVTALILVNGYNGFGVHTVLSVIRNYRNYYRNFVFLSVGIVDSGSFKGSEEVGALSASVKESLEKYVSLARSLGFPAEYRMEMGTEVVETASLLCRAMAEKFPQSMFFMGQLTFRLEKFYHRLLHNETAFALQRRLHWHGIPAVILPIRVEV